MKNKNFIFEMHLLHESSNYKLWTHCPRELKTKQKLKCIFYWNLGPAHKWHNIIVLTMLV